jgi:hypothetical protein
LAVHDSIVEFFRALIIHDLATLDIAWRGIERLGRVVSGTVLQTLSANWRRGFFLSSAAFSTALAITSSEKEVGSSARRINNRSIAWRTVTA